MQLFQNLLTGALINGFFNPETIPGGVISVKRGDTVPFAIQFGNPFGVAQEIDAITAITAFKFGVKQVGDYEGTYVASNYAMGSWPVTKTGGSKFTDIATTNAEPGVESATAGFTQDDVGLQVICSKFASGTTILSVQDDENATLSNNASADGADQTLTILGRTPVYTTSVVFDTAKLNNLLGYDPNGFAETALVDCEADLASSLAGLYFDLNDFAGPVRLWFKVGGAGAQPANPAGGRRLEVDFAANSTASQVATAIAAVLAGDASFTPSTATGPQVSAVLVNVGPVKNGAAPDHGTSPFDVTLWLVGSLPGTLPQLDSVTLIGEIRVLLNGAPLTGATFNVQVFNDVNKGTEGIPPVPTPSLAAILGFWFYPAITAIIGGGAADLDALATANLPTGFRADFVLAASASEKHYQLQAGGGGVHGPDYDAGTNNRSWVEVL